MTTLNFIARLLRLETLVSNRKRKPTSRSAGITCREALLLSEPLDLSIILIISESNHRFRTSGALHFLCFNPIPVRMSICFCLLRFSFNSVRLGLLINVAIGHTLLQSRSSLFSTLALWVKICWGLSVKIWYQGLTNHFIRFSPKTVVRTPLRGLS